MEPEDKDGERLAAEFLSLWRRQMESLITSPENFAACMKMIGGFSHILNGHGAALHKEAHEKEYTTDKYTAEPSSLSSGSVGLVLVQLALRLSDIEGRIGELERKTKKQTGRSRKSTGANKRAK